MESKWEDRVALRVHTEALVFSFTETPFVWTILKYFLSGSICVDVSPQKSEKTPSSSCGNMILKYLFEAARIVFPGKKYKCFSI